MKSSKGVKSFADGGEVQAVNTLKRNQLSVLWLGVTLNMAFADILGLYVPGTVQQMLDGNAEGVELSARLMLIAAAFIQIPIAMAVVSQFLSEKLLKWITFIAALITAIFIVGGGSMKPHYLFIAACELVMLLSVVLIAAGSSKRAGSLLRP